MGADTIHYFWRLQCHARISAIETASDNRHRFANPRRSIKCKSVTERREGTFTSEWAIGKGCERVVTCALGPCLRLFGPFYICSCTTTDALSGHPAVGRSSRLDLVLKANPTKSSASGGSPWLQRAKDLHPSSWVGP